MRLHIAMISEHASPLADLGGVDAGGQNVHVARLASALARQGHDVRVYTRRDAPNAPTVVRADGYTVEHVLAGPPVPMAKDELLPLMGAFGAYLRTRWENGDFVPDVVHAHFWMSGLAAIAATTEHSRPIVVTYHALGSVKRRMQGDADTSPPSRVILERTVAQAATTVIAQCTDEIMELRAYGLRRDKITMVPSGVDTDAFAPAADHRADPAGLPARRVLSVGRLVPRKGFADLVRALPALDGVELTIVGGPSAGGLDTDPEACRLRLLAAELGVAGRLHLRGAVPQSGMADLYRSHDLLACTPDYEPFGITPLEAMACGVPVVAYAVGGLRDSVRHGVTGLQAPPRDVGALAAAIRSLLDDDVRRARYGRAAAETARLRYPWPVIARQVAQVYQRACVSHATGPDPLLTSLSGHRVAAR